MTSNEPPIGTIVHTPGGIAFERLENGWHMWECPWGDGKPDPEHRMFLSQWHEDWHTIIVRYGPITQGMQP